MPSAYRYELGALREPAFYAGRMLNMRLHDYLVLLRASRVLVLGLLVRTRTFHLNGHPTQHFG